MSEEDQEIKISTVKKTNRIILEDDEVAARPIDPEEVKITSNTSKKKENFSVTKLLKFVGVLCFAMFGAAMLGSAIGSMIKNPLFFFNLSSFNIAFYIGGFVLLLLSILLIGIFFSEKYIYLLITAVALAIVMSASTFMFENLFLFAGISIGMFLVLIMFFIGIEGDVMNQFSFRFWQAVRSASVFTTWFTFCLMACYSLSLISLLGSSNYKVPESVVDTVFNFADEGTGGNLKNINKSLTDLEKSGVNISFLKSFSPTNLELSQTPKEFLTMKLNDFVKSNTVLISIVIAVNMFFIVRFLSSFLAFFTKIITLIIFKILKSLGFYNLEKVEKEAFVIKI